MNLLFRTRAEGGFSLEVRDSWSRRTVSGDFVPPFTPRYLNTLLKKLDRQELSHQGLQEIGERLFAALCGTRGRTHEEASATSTSGDRQEPESVGVVLRTVIQRTLHRRGTVALTLSFTPGCDEFMRYPWELLHNGEHFLIAAGVFTLTRILVRPDEPVGCDLPVHLPMSMLYIGASPSDCEPLQTERSFEALRRGLASLIESGRLILNRLEPCTFGELVRYLSSYGGVGLLDDSEVQIPCYVVHFDGHGAYGRLCPRENCGTLNDPEERHCSRCATALNGVKAQTYLCFCDEEGRKDYIDTHALREVLTSSDVRLVVLSACETAWLESERSRQRHVAFDRSLATALLTAQIPAVVAMPFSLQDELGPIFIYHFYEALAAGRTLEEALSRARHAMLPLHQSGWFIPVLYRQVSPGCEEPSPLIAGQDEQEDEALLANLEAPTCFVGRERELAELTALLTAAAQGEEHALETQRGGHLRPGMRHIVLTGPAGIGKSALAFEVARRNRETFPGAGGIIGISLRGGKTFAEALLEMAHFLPALPARLPQISDVRQRSRLVLTGFHARSDRELPCLLLIDGFEEVTEQAEYKLWLRFLAELPRRVVVLLTSHSNPATLGVPAGVAAHWYEYPVDKMTDEDLLRLFQELAAQSGLDKRIHLDDPVQQEILREICRLLDGYPLGAALIFGTARSIGGKIYTPEAATRSLEEVRDQLRRTPLAGIWAVLEVAYLRLSPSARLLLSYLSAFKLPFTTRQIVMLVAPGETEPLSREPAAAGTRAAGAVVPPELAAGWQGARDELVQASFMGFDGRVYTIHPQVRKFALSYLPAEERHRVHRLVAAYYLELAHPSPEEWFAAFEHLAEAEELQEAVRTAVRAARVLRGRGHAQQLLAILRRAESYALSSADPTGEGQIQCSLGAMLRQLGNYAEALACLTRSLALHRAQGEDEPAGWALYELAMLAREEGHLEQAEEYAGEALETFRQAACAQGEAWAWLALSQIMCGYGRYTLACEQLSTALAAFRQRGDQEGCAWALLVKANIHEAQGAYEEARALCAEAERLFSTLGLRIGSAWILQLRVTLALAQGRLDEAEQYCSQALEIFRGQGLRRGEGLALWCQGNIWRKRGEARNARSFYEKALAIFAALGARLDQARLFNSQGALSLTEGALHAAKEYFEQALMIAGQHGARRLEERAYRGLGDTLRSLRLFDAAAAHYERAATIAAELGLLAEESAVACSLGELCCAQEQYLQALQHWMHALLLARRLAHPRQQELGERIEALVREQQLQEAYQDLCRQYNL